MAPLLLCLVVAISDGDTIKVRCGETGAYEEIRVRLAEIDAPEKNQPFGQRSKQSLSDLCYQARAVIKPVTKDRYGRTVARVECRGKDANSSQVQAGLAWAYTKYLTDQGIKRDEEAARAAGLGLWADKNPMPPWEWRHR
jgi:endonuclease YncB( thermonuclease family)